jgi:hypothetical protein
VREEKMRLIMYKKTKEKKERCCWKGGIDYETRNIPKSVLAKMISDI